MGDGRERRITEAFPAPGGLAAALRPNSPARHAACKGTRRAELSEFGNARNVSRHCGRKVG